MKKNLELYNEKSFLPSKIRVCASASWNDVAELEAIPLKLAASQMLEVEPCPWR